MKAERDSDDVSPIVEVIEDDDCPRNMVKCEICAVRVMSKSLVSHCSGAKHNKRVQERLARDKKKKEMGEREVSASVGPEVDDGVLGAQGDMMRCHLCNILIVPAASHEHLNGKRHKKNLSKVLKEIDGGRDEVLGQVSAKDADAIGKGWSWCNICSKRVPPGSFSEHIAGARHKKKAQSLGPLQTVESTGEDQDHEEKKPPVVLQPRITGAEEKTNQETAAKDGKDKTKIPNGFSWCNVCELPFPTANMKQHSDGSRHKKKLLIGKEQISGYGPTRNGGVLSSRNPEGEPPSECVSPVKSPRLFNCELCQCLVVGSLETHRLSESHRHILFAALQELNDESFPPFCPSCNVPIQEPVDDHFASISHLKNAEATRGEKTQAPSSFDDITHVPPTENYREASDKRTRSKKKTNPNSQQPVLDSSVRLLKPKRRTTHDPGAQGELEPSTSAASPTSSTWTPRSEYEGDDESDTSSGKPNIEYNEEKDQYGILHGTSNSSTSEEEEPDNEGELGGVSEAVGGEMQAGDLSGLMKKTGENVGSEMEDMEVLVEEDEGLEEEDDDGDGSGERYSPVELGALDGMNPVSSPSKEGAMVRSLLQDARRRTEGDVKRRRKMEELDEFIPLGFEFQREDDEGNGQFMREDGELDHDEYVPGSLPPWVVSDEVKILLECNADLETILHYEILDFEKYMTPTEAEHDARADLVERVRDIISSIWPECTALVFGSYASGLFLPSSDVDICVMPFEPEQGATEHLHAVADAMRDAGFVKKIQLIERTKVPLVKIVDKETTIQCDISFGRANGPNNVPLIKEYTQNFPGLRALLLVAKCFLHQRNLNEVYRGGVGSYALLLLIVSHLQMWEKNFPSSCGSLGALLIDFFDLYGRKFNYVNSGIRIKGGGGYFVKEDQYPPDPTAPELLSIEDPQDVTNELCRNSHSILTVRKAFTTAYDKITQWKASDGAPTPLSSILNVDDFIWSRKNAVEEEWQKTYQSRKEKRRRLP
eukprot:CAMPEP_0184680816 /NCGR_PEP_ID=MMETSP0312-20130426/3730_1 /TAXON_ID=31354 /ORGANISM="Compsopogon coeruleus, Strain SAG 36.94" /LENGTH=995 /DNA_ID=CAMNT_0027131197 /DNA_START=51 /DNA_END=3041 /DNA_ORIENTATION=-